MALHGGIITRRPLCLTADGRLLLAPCGSDVRVYSAKSGDHIATLRGHTAEVTAVVQDPSSGKLVLSASLDGTLRQWDVEEGSVLHTWTVGEPIESMVLSKPAGLAYVSIHYKRGQAGRVVPYQLPSGAEAPGRVKTSQPAPLAASPSGAHVAAIDRNSLFVWAAGSSASGRRAKPLNLTHTKHYTCAAFDPTDSVIAAGDATGRILVWHDFAGALRRWSGGGGGDAPLEVAAATMAVDGAQGPEPPRMPACTTVHWHAHAVGALCFSLDGAHLMSGGQEGVLVQWALPAGKRNYLPRLGGPLRGITASRADPAKFVVAQSDNTVRLVNTATMAVELSVHGLRPPPAAAALAAAGYGACCSAASSGPAGAVLQPGSGHLVVPAEHAMLQFFDVARDRHVARLQVTPRNPLSLTEAATNHASAAAAATAAAGPPPAAPLAPSVVLAAFAGGGEALVTVDVRPSTSACLAAPAAEATLRFWDRAASQVAGSSAPYDLNTSADVPHRGVVTGLACHPWRHVAATTGSDGEFRVWARAPARGGGGGGGGGGGHWRCSAVGGYKGLPLTACSFSHDGSLLAVGAGATATLWDPHDASLVASLCCPPELSGGSLRHLAFVAGSPHLVGVVGGGQAAPGALAALGLDGAQQQQQQQHAQATKQQRLRRQRQQQLAAQALGAWGSGVVVWNLLSSNVSWYCSLPVCSLAADPAFPVFAVGVPALLDAAAAGEQQQEQPQQQQQQQQQEGGDQKQAGEQRPGAAARRQGLVLVLGPGDPSPLLACPVPGSSPSSLLFLPGAGRSGGSSKARPASAPRQQQQQQQMSQLLLLTEDRQYTKLAPPAQDTGADDSAAPGSDGGEQLPSGTRAAMAAEQAAGAGESALESVFGRAERQQPAAAGAGGGGAAAAEELAAVKASVELLFDAPSHVLPPPSALCPTLLELLIGAGRRE